MSLSSIQLDAFRAVAQTKNFSHAARLLHITQSALSQRILNLEATLATAVFTRDTSGVRLTEAGEKLLHYCIQKNKLEEEILGHLKPGQKSDVSGFARIAGFSTFVRSRLIPRVADFRRKHPFVHFEVLTREVRELAQLLLSGQTDFIFSTEPIEKKVIINEPLGHEINMLIAPTKGTVPRNVYIDHDMQDPTTALFWKAQKKPAEKYERIYFDEIYAIIDAVEAGFGCAVVPLHLIQNRPGVKVVSGLNPLRVPIFLSYYMQPFYTRLQTELLKSFQSFKSRQG